MLFDLSQPFAEQVDFFRRRLSGYAGLWSAHPVLRTAT
jgi:hypothetical protein